MCKTSVVFTFPGAVDWMTTSNQSDIGFHKTR